MRKIFLFLAAAALCVGCDNLKGKTDKDEKETTLDKKKPLRDEEDSKNNNEDEYDSKTRDRDRDRDRNDVVDDNDEPTDRDRDNNDGDDEFKSDEGSGEWSSGDVNRFVRECMGTAEKKVGRETAQRYCECMTEKAQRDYSSYQSANTGITKTWVDRNAADCNQKAADY